MAERITKRIRPQLVAAESSPSAKNKVHVAPQLQLAGVGQLGSNEHGNPEGLRLTSDWHRNDISGKPYPGRVNFTTQKTLGNFSTVVRAIVTLRSHQVAKLPYTIIPKNKEEPPKQPNLLEYSVYDIEHHPALDEAEVTFLTKIFRRLDPKNYVVDKKDLYEEMHSEFSDTEHATLEHLQEKHEEFYYKRNQDIREIKRLLDRPDPYFTNTNTWQSFIKKVLYDLLLIDRGAVIKLRDESGFLKGLLPIDGGTLRPLLDEYGFLDDEKAYVQTVHGTANVYLRKDDVIIFMAYPTPDMKFFGYGHSAMETLYTTVLSDIFIDKGNLDYYRKGGSIPEGFISVEPPPSREGAVMAVDEEYINSLQRHLQAIMMGDYTQIPIVSGAKVSWIDFKGKRKDMQFRELADYLSRKICAVFQVSPQDIGITQDVNRSTSQTQAEMTKSKGLETLMRVVSEYMTDGVLRELRPEDDLMLWFEDDDDEKIKNEWNVTQQKLVSGVLTINQVRAMDGLHPVPWGNTPLQGLRNWKPEEEGAGAGGPPPGGLPPLPGMPPPGGAPGGMPPGMPPGGMPPGMMNPGGPMGGANPMSGQAGGPPGAPSPLGSPSNLKSSRFFAMNAATDEEAYDLMIKGFSDMYMDNSNYQDLVNLYDINNYPGGEYLRKPIESYEHLASRYGIGVTKNIEVDEVDPIVFSRYIGNGQVVVDEIGEEPIIKSISRALQDNISADTLRLVEQEVGGKKNLDVAIERAVYKSLDAPLQEALYEDFYKYQTTPLTDAQIQKAGEHLGIL